MKVQTLTEGPGLEAYMTEAPFQMRWVNNAEKRRWMHSLAMLMEVIGDNSTILKSDREREEYKAVCARLKQEFEHEGLTWPLDE
jgi:hypothetical protein